MTNSKIYLDVPFAQKDQAKALGARWDAVRKKWYIPSGTDSAPFAKWKPEAMSGDGSPAGGLRAGNGRSSDTKSAGRAARSSAQAQGGMTIAHTQPLDKNFVPYCGEEPPWE